MLIKRLKYYVKVLCYILYFTFTLLTLLSYLFTGDKLYLLETYSKCDFILMPVSSFIQWQYLRKFDELLNLRLNQDPWFKGLSGKKLCNDKYTEVKKKQY